MCIIAVCHKRRLTDDELTQCWTANDEGAGVAWYDRDGELNFRKGIKNFTELTAFYQRLNTLPHVVHFRIATHGGVRPENCHPFPVRASIKNPLEGEKINFPLLFHNGVFSFQRVLPVLEKKFPGLKKADHSKLVDSQIMAILLACFPDFNPSCFDSFSRYALLFPKGKPGKPRIKLYGNFHQVNGVYFSNESYKPPALKSYNASLMGLHGYYYSGYNYSKNYGKEE